MTWVSIDGLEGAGKTTLIKGLKSRLAGAHVLAEYSDTFCGKALAAAVMESPHRVSSSAVAQSLYFLAEFIEKIEAARPIIESHHQIALTDRGTFSKIVYQKIILEPHIGPDATMALLTSSLSCLPVPDVTLWLQVDPEVARQRIERRGERRTAADFVFMKSAAEEFERLAAEYTTHKFDTTNNSPSELCDLVHASLAKTLHAMNS